MEENDQTESAWIAGHRAAWVHLLRMCLQELGYDSAETEAHGWIIEREAAIVQLRDLCAEFGDNDWPDDLDLADVISKHLGDYLLEDTTKEGQVALT